MDPTIACVVALQTIRPKCVNDGGTQRAVGQRSLGGFELELEAERIQGSGSFRQFTCDCLGQHGTGEQTPIKPSLDQ
jgi:hypothetical protein